MSHPTLFPPGSINCPTCGGCTQHSYWNDGSSESTQPRLIHDIQNVVHLVSAVYPCDNKLSHDEMILKQFTLHCMIPFILLCRTGFTLELVTTCTALCTCGMNFYNIETFTTGQRWESFAQQQQVYRCITGQCANTDFWCSPFSHTPNNDIISQCFQTIYFLNLSNFMYKS